MARKKKRAKGSGSSLVTPRKGSAGLTEEEKKAIKRARRKERRERKKLGLEPESQTRRPYRPAPVPATPVGFTNYARRIVKAMEVPVVKEPGDRNWYCFSVAAMKAEHGDPATSAKWIISRIKEMNLKVKRAVIITHGSMVILGFGPLEGRR